MNHKVEITKVNADGYTADGNYQSASIVGLPDIYLHFAHHNYNYVWNPKTKTQDRVDEDVFFGGMGEGSKFKTWQDAILCSLYDAYQCYDGLNDGDTFEVEYLGEVAHFACEGVHVFNTDRVDSQTKALIEAEVFGEYDDETI